MSETTRLNDHSNHTGNNSNPCERNSYDSNTIVNYSKWLLAHLLTGIVRNLCLFENPRGFGDAATPLAQFGHR